MAEAPRVQPLAEIITELAPGYAEQEQVIGQQKEAVGQEFAAQREGLEAKKVQGFNQINDQAIGRGAAFSGIPLHEQADYLSDVYLPGVQTSNAQENQAKLSLSMQLAQMRTEQRNRALDTRTTQTGYLNQWNINERGIEATAEQNRLNRVFEAEQGALTRNHQSSLAAADRAASGAAQGPTNQQIIGSVDAWLGSRAGKDKKVNPADFRAGYQQFVSAGGAGSFEDYTTLFRNRISNKYIK